MEDHSTELEFLNHAHDHVLNYSNAQQITETTDEIMDIAPLEGFFKHDWASQFPFQSSQLSFLNELEFEDIENFSHRFNLPPLDEDDFGVDQNPLNIVLPGTSGFGIEEKEAEKKQKKEEEEEEENQEMPAFPSSGRQKRSVLEFDEIKKHFELPITKAAKKMNVGLTMLKRRCRELNITRWPHRRLQSLNTLINNVKELGMDDDEIAKLEKLKLMLERVPGMELNEKTMKLRQACFKARYKRKRRCLALEE